MTRSYFTILALVLSPLAASPFTLSSSSDPNMKGWANKTVTFNVNTSSCPANIFDILDGAMAVWNNVATSKLEVKRGASSSATPAQLRAGTATDTPVIACDPNFGTTTGLSPAAVAGAGVAVNTSVGGNLVYGYLLLNVQLGAAANISNFNNTTISIVLAHEIGHVLGIGHSADTAALMYFDASAKTQLTLAQDDIDAVTYLYPRSEIGGDQMLGGCALVKDIARRGGRGGSAIPLTALAALLLPLLLLYSLRSTTTRV